MRVLRSSLLFVSAAAVASVFPACGGSGDSSLSSSTSMGGAATAGGASAGKAGGGGAQAGKGGSGGGAAGAATGGSSTGGAAGGAAGNGASGGAAGKGANAGGGSAGTSGKAGAGGSAGKSGSGGASAGASGAGGSGGGCTSSSQCGAGVCVFGSCCASAANVCGTACCPSGTACLFDACVVPGKSCQTANDCAAGEYCETALGTGGSGGAAGGGGKAGGAICTQPVPQAGKCLPLPPVCDAQGNPPGCFAACEYKPPVGKLTAIEKWHWGPLNAKAKPDYIDVWSTPTVGRVADANCDGKVDLLDPPNVIFVAGHTGGTCCQCNGATPTNCHTGTLRLLDGATGEEIWTLDRASPTSSGFAGMSVALGDVTGDGRIDVVAMTGEGFLVVVDGSGKVIATSDKAIVGNGDAAFGWGGGVSIADMDHDGFPEIAFAAAVFTTKGMTATGVIKQLWVGKGGIGGTGISTPLSFFADVDGAPDGNLELVAGNTAYKVDGTELWKTAGVADGFPAIGDFDKDGLPEIAVVANGTLTILHGADGTIAAGPFTLPGNGSGGPPTIADMDGDGKPEVGLAQANFYSALKIDLANKKISVLWKTANHDLSSSVTGSSVFDFEGDGRAEVIYNDECFLWVFDGVTGAVRFATPTTSFTATESSVVADVDGDGHAEILWIANGVDPGPNGWKCDEAPWNMPDPATGRPAWVKPSYGASHRGLAIFGDSASSWVGTRSQWSEHAYHVTNICDAADSACDAPDVSGSIPKSEKANWKLPWLNDFRQNVQEKGIFNAPDAIVSLDATCTDPIVLTASVKNVGLASLPAGVDVGFFLDPAPQTKLGEAKTTHPLAPGQTEKLVWTLAKGMGGPASVFQAHILIDPKNPTFHECKTDNDDSAKASPVCIKP